jgi:hypothetical protein
VRLFGPFPLDLRIPQVGGRAALAAFRGRPTGWVPPEGDRRPPGLYLSLVEEGGAYRLLGFHVVAGPDWLAEGPGPTPDRLPPLAEDLLELLVEAIWWRELPVAGAKGGRWRPLIVLEWPPRLAMRSATPPPGVQAADALPHTLDEDDGNWLALGAGASTAIRPRPVTVTVEDAISPQRSLLCLIRAELVQSSSAHTGRWCLLGPEDIDASALPVEEATWQTAGATGSLPPTLSDEAALGPPLRLPRGGVGYPMAGWLLRSLDRWPLRPKEAQVGQLAPRDVRSEVLTRLVQSVMLTLLVSLPTLALALTIRAISSPQETSAPEAKTIDPQPAISVCSPHHARYVAELRCQIEALAAGVPVDVPVCAEPDAQPFTPPALGPNPDLQPVWCGLFDRARDGGTLRLSRAGKAAAVSHATFAATQACFNVLGQPDPYELKAGPGDGPRALGNPVSFLEDAELRILPLDGLVGALESTCEAWRSPLEKRVEGAIFATHVGGNGPESGPMRAALIAQSTAEEGELERRCFEAGATLGPDAASFTTLCEGQPLLPTERAAEAWKAIGGQSEGSMLDAYARARFPEGPASATPEPLWRCHLVLESGGEGVMMTTWWDFAMSLPRGYNVEEGVVGTQMMLDALIGAARAGEVDTPCFGVVTGRLESYTPVHPLLGGLVDDSAWSLEQQLCGQTCAVAYRLLPAAAPGWLTPESDLAECVDRRSPLGREPLLDGLGVRDRLWVPWYGKTGDRSPTHADVCAFNLLAQELLPPPEGGLLPGAVPGVAWAGETSLGSRIAGGATGAAVTAAVNLDTYGRSRSRESCGHVATQCFTSLLLDVTRSRPPVDPYLWPQTWSAAVSRLLDPRRRGAAPMSPWCEEILPFLKPDGVLPEGQFDFPCAKGVEEARQRVAASILRIASGSDTP